MTIIFVEIKQEPKSNKRMVAYFYNDLGKKIKTVRFGSDNGSTFIDHEDSKIKKNWLARHSKIKGIDYSNPLKPSTLSKDILWGDSTSLKKNIDSFKKKFDLL